MLFIGFLVFSSISVERRCSFPFLEMGTLRANTRDIDDFDHSNLATTKFSII